MYISNLIELIMTKIVEFMSIFGYWGISIGMVVESACIPLPSELILPVAGFMAASNKITLLGANLSVLCGSLIGSIAAYGIGYNYGRSFIFKYGKYMLISDKHFIKAEKFFDKYGCTAVLIGRLLPVIRTFISLPAGITRMNLAKFIIFSAAGAIPWNFTLIYLGYKFQKEYERIISPIFHNFEIITVAVLLLILLGFMLKQLLNCKT